MGARRKAVAGQPLTDADIIIKASRIIRGGRAAEDAVKAELFFMRHAADAIARGKALYSKQHRRAIRQLAAALRRAAHDLPEDMKFNGLVDWLSHHFDIYETVSLRPKPDAFEKRLAAEAALRLCNEFKLPRSTTYFGTYYTLAAILYGDERADLQHQCRAARKEDAARAPMPTPRQAREWKRAGEKIMIALKKTGAKPAQK